MYQLNSTALKILKIVHILLAMCWFGGAMSLLVINMVSSNPENASAIYGLTLASHKVDMGVVVIMGAVGCAVTGLIYSVFSHWGFTKYAWVAIKWCITIFAILFGTFFLGVWEVSMLELAKDGVDPITDLNFTNLRSLHFSGGLLNIFLLAVAVILTIFKPKKVLK